MQDLVNVEAIPYDVMKAGIDWQWESYGQYLDAVDRRGLGINVAGPGGVHPAAPLRHGRGLVRAGGHRRRDRRHAAAAARGDGGGRLRLHHHHLAQSRRLPGPAAGLPQRQPGGADRRRARPRRRRARRDRDHPELRRHVRGERRGRRAPAADHAGERPAGDVARAVRPSGPARLPRPDLRQARRSREAGHPAGDAAADHEPGRSEEPDHVRLVRLLAEGVQPARGRADRALPRSRVPRGLPAGAGEPASAATCGARCACWKWAGPSWRATSGARLEEIAASQGKRPVDAYFDLGIADDLETRFQSSTFNFDPGGHRAAHRRRPLPDRALRRRRARRLHLRRGLRHRAARPLGAPARGAEPREGRAQADAGAGRRCSAFPTAACWRRARSPISCCSTRRR